MKTDVLFHRGFSAPRTGVCVSRERQAWVGISTRLVCCAVVRFGFSRRATCNSTSFLQLVMTKTPDSFCNLSVLVSGRRHGPFCVWF